MNNGDIAVTSPRTAPAAIPAKRLLYWSVRRELWENRFLYLVPLIVSAIVLFASFIHLFGFPRRMQNALTLDPARQHAVIVGPFSMAPAPIMFATFLVGLFYCLDALYGERRDRSILFWKSLPVSDRTTVLSKVTVPLVVLPLFAFALALVTQRFMMLQATAVLVANGMSAAPLWKEFRFFQESLVMLYGLVVHALWYAPIYGWLLLVSAWAKRAPLLWALVPPMLISAFERGAFGTRSFMRMLQYRVTGAMQEAFLFTPRRDSHPPLIDQLSQLDPARFLTRPGLWVGLAFAVVCLVAAVRLRRNREPI
ncbi:MAG TPA: ABC transporter permease [Thermoanaerobaculia bacterium]|nr:ABC transporter permease [Thermoanaerobaculia bacterium]